MNLLELFGIQLPRRHNTRRNRLRALRKEFNRENEFFDSEPPHWSALENECICVAHLADFIDQGGTVKAYSAWSGCSVREISRQLDNFRHQRLPGQRMIGKAQPPIERGGAK